MVDQRQNDDAPMLLRQLANGVFQFVPELPLLESLFGASPIRHLVRLVERDELEPWTTALLQECAMSDFEDPGRESGRSSDVELR